MKLTVDVAALARELAPVVRLVGGGVGSIAVCECVRVEALKPDRLALSGTNFAESFATRCEAEVAEPGVALLNAKGLASLLKTLSGVLTIEVGPDHYAKLKCGGMSAKLPGLDPADFPQIPKAPKKAWATFEAAPFLSAIDKVIFIPRNGTGKRNASAADYAECIRLVVEKGGAASLYTTDRNRLARATFAGMLVGEPNEILIPWKAAQALLHMREEIEREEPPAPVLVMLEDRPDGLDALCFFVVGDRVLGAKTVAGKFPAVEKVLARRERHQDVTVNVGALAGACRRVGLAVLNAVQIDALDDKLVLLAETPDKGRIEEVLPVEYSLPGRTVTVSLAYLTQFLETCEADTVVLSLDAEPEAPILGRPGTEGDVAHVYVAMPVHK